MSSKKLKKIAQKINSQKLIFCAKKILTNTEKNDIIKSEKRKGTPIKNRPGKGKKICMNL